jgi:hypothetical protein
MDIAKDPKVMALVGAGVLSLETIEKIMYLSDHAPELLERAERTGMSLNAAYNLAHKERTASIPCSKKTKIKQATKKVSDLYTTLSEFTLSSDIDEPLLVSFSVQLEKLQQLITQLLDDVESLSLSTEARFYNKII